MKSRKEIWENIKFELEFLWEIKADIVMGLMMLCSIGILIFALSPNRIKKRNNEKLIYRNEKVLIVGSNESQGISADKFNQPVVIKVWLVQRLSDTTKFAELSTQNSKIITNELWYSKGIGDTLYFDYIRKDRFFTINKKEKNENIEN